MSVVAIVCFVLKSKCRTYCRPHGLSRRWVHTTARLVLTHRIQAVCKQDVSIKVADDDDDDDDDDVSIMQGSSGCFARRFRMHHHIQRDLPCGTHEEDNSRVRQQRNTHRELPLVPCRQVAHKYLN